MAFSSRSCHSPRKLGKFIFQKLDLGVISELNSLSCRFTFGLGHGRLKYGPPVGFSAIFEALNRSLDIQDCLTFGDLVKNTYSGPSPILHTIKPFVPTPTDTSSITLPSFATEIHFKFAENLHELWAKRKIDLGWTFAEVNSISLEINFKQRILRYGMNKPAGTPV